MPQRETVNAWLKIAGGMLIGAACLWLSLRTVHLSLFFRALSQVSWPWVALALAGVMLVGALKALRWQWLYPPDAPPLPWTTHFSILMISQMLNLLVPVRLGELARMGLMRQEGRPVGTTLGTIVLEKSLDLLVVPALLLITVPLALLPGWLRSRAGAGALVLGAGLLAALLLVGRFRGQLVALLGKIPQPDSPLWARWAGRAQRLVQTTLDSIAALDGPRTARLMALTAVIWLLSAAVLQAMLVAFRIPADWGAACVLMIGLTFSNWVPTPPAMIGVVGAVSVAALAPFGVPAAQALALGTVLNVVLVAPTVLLGGWATWTRLWELRASARSGRLNRALGLTPSERPGDPAKESDADQCG